MSRESEGHPWGSHTEGMRERFGLVAERAELEGEVSGTTSEPSRRMWLSSGQLLQKDTAARHKLPKDIKASRAFGTTESHTPH